MTDKVKGILGNLYEWGQLSSDHGDDGEGVIEASQALLDHLLSLPELQIHPENKLVEADHDIYKVMLMENAITKDLRAALIRELGGQPNEQTD